MSPHTPGPWEAQAPAFGFRGVRSPDGKAVCGMPTNESWPQADANAALIALARTLLPALLDEVEAGRRRDAGLEAEVARLEQEREVARECRSYATVMVCDDAAARLRALLGDAPDGAGRET